MTKRVLHLQIPLMDIKAPIRDSFGVSAEVASKFVSLVKDKLGDDWLVVLSPFNPSVSEDGQTFYNFKMEQLTKEELMNLIK
jgi:hypothetical protein